MDHQQQAPQASMRFMQVKVLYTFNDDSKSNCLARCPQPLNIQTARLDQNVEIGIIELRTCIQAIAATSPELVAKLGQDFTVYAYDYSEYETPLVGQGMLSWILATSSSTPTAPAHQSHTMVTGRVCKNVLGLFSGGASEALEVKLRLVPVPTTLQSEYLASLEKYRSINNAPSLNAEQESDAAAWSSFLQTSPQFEAQQAPASTAPAHQTLPPRPNTANQTFRPASRARPADDSSQFNPTHNTLFSDGPGIATTASHGLSQSRPTTPPQQQQQSQQQARKRANPPSRPTSRNSNRGRPALKQTASCASRMETAETSEAEDGHRRKRARVTQTDWNGSSNFGTNAGPLRVAAATAASIRGNRPSNMGSLTSDAMACDVGDRPPTPRPRQGAARPPIPSLPRSLTTPAYELHQPRPSTKRPPNKNDPLGILESSPEKNDSSAGSSPMDLPSSPPIIRHASPSPCSPPLAPMSRFQDSGFASGNLDEFLPEFNGCNERGESVLEEQNGVGQGEARQTDAPQSAEGPTNTAVPGRKLLPGPPPVDQQATRSSAKSIAPSSPVQSKRPRAPRSRAGSVSKPTILAKSSAHPHGETLHADQSTIGSSSIALLATAVPADDGRFRSESLLGDFGSSAGSPPNDGSVRVGQPRQEHQKKKQAIQTKLAESIKAGQLPRFCNNCGEINTASWRKAFVKLEAGEPKHLQISDAQTGVLTWEAVERTAEGVISSYRVVKKLVTEDDEGFEEVSLCNPCGIWLFKNKRMRPPEAWDKQPPQPARRKSSSTKRKSAKRSKSQSDGLDEDMENSGDQESTTNSGDSVPLPDNPVQSTEADAPRPARRKCLQRSNSVGPSMLPTRNTMGKASAQAALQRAIQSSPPKFPGSRVSPIELDSDAVSPSKPIKRLLFPSPRKLGEVKSLDPTVDKQVSPSKQPSKRAIFDADGEKENMMPAANADEDASLNDFLNGNTRYLTTPKQAGYAPDPMKTPRSSTKRTPLTARSHQRRGSEPATPSRACGNMLPGLPETPWSTRLSRILSESNDAGDLNFSFSPFTARALEDPGMFGFTDLGDTNGSFALHDDGVTAGDDIWSGNGFYDGDIDALLDPQVGSS